MNLNLRRSSFAQLKKLGFKNHPDATTSYVVDDVEGLVIDAVVREDRVIRCTLKSLTNSFTPGLFQYVCSYCASMTKGTIWIEIDAPAEAGLLEAIDKSTLKQAITKTVTKDQPPVKFYRISFDYSPLLKN